MFSVRVKLYATLRQYAPNPSSREPFSVELKEGSSIAELLNGLGIPELEAGITIVNGRQVAKDHPLEPGCEVILFPPMAGGQIGYLAASPKLG